MNGFFEGLQLRAIAAAVPAQTVDLHGLASRFGKKEIELIMGNTGITRIRQAPQGVTASDLCARAAREIFSVSGIAPNSIDGVVFVSQTPDYILPATSVCLQHRLGIPSSAVAFDINYGCSGYIYGLFQAALLVHAGCCRRVLVCAGDVTTGLINPDDRSVRMVFGDAGSATVVERGDSFASFAIRSDGSGADKLMIPAGGCRHPRSAETSVATERENGNLRSDEDMYMDGMGIMNFAISEVPKMVQELLERMGWEKGEVGTFGFHQANRFMLQYLARKMGLEAGGVPVAVEGIGNTGPASIPVMLSSQGQRLKAEDRLDKTLLCGFGVGLSWGGVALNLSGTEIIPWVEL